MAVGRKRRTDKHLPRRVYRRHGAYYFVDAAGRWHRLGDSLSEMYAALSRFIEARPCETVKDLVERYQREVLASYSAKEQKNRAPHLARIVAVFGEMLPQEVTGQHVRAFRDRIGERGGKEWGRPQRALKALAALSHVFTWACEWGVVDKNPCAGVLRPPQPKRKRYPTDAEFRAVRDRCPPMHQVAMDIAYLTGLRRENVLAIDRDSETDEGLRVFTGKTGKLLLFKWTDELREVMRRGWSLGPRVRRYLICTRDGQRYTGDGFYTIWKRARAKALQDGALEHPYRFNDIRAKSATDDEDLDRASKRLGHTTRQTTERFYIRGAKKVEPLR